MVKVHFDLDDATAVFDPHVDGLFSYGMSLSYPAASAVVAGTSNITPDPALDDFGFSSPALKQVVAGAARVKSNINPSNSTPYFGTLLATFEITNNAPALSTYTLDLDEWRTLGPTEQIFIDGLGNVLDTAAGGMLSFGSAHVQVVPEPTSGCWLLLYTAAAMSRQFRAHFGPLSFDFERFGKTRHESSQCSSMDGGGGCLDSRKKVRALWMWMRYRCWAVGLVFVFPMIWRIVS